MISSKVATALDNHSWIRTMFQEGKRLKMQFEEKEIFDFSIGNPALNPPKDFYDAMNQVIESPVKGKHGYGDYQGIFAARQKIAFYLQERFSVDFTPNHIVMTVGAAGAMNVVLKSILNEQDEVIVLSPYFLEYEGYIQNFNGKIVPVSLNNDFSINFESIKQALSKTTKAIILNSPHNPTGIIHTQQELNELGKLLDDYEHTFNQPIYVIYDTPYEQLIFDSVYSNPFSAYKHIIFIGSFSKELGISGERIGYIALSSDTPNKETLTSALVYCNRILGFIHAPMLMQRIIGEMVTLKIDPSPYKVRKDLIVSILRGAGFEFIDPQGGFFVFPKAPIEDDIEFCVEVAKKFKVLTVPGSQFGRRGYFRLSYSVPLEQIQNSKEVFHAIYKHFSN